MNDVDGLEPRVIADGAGVVGFVDEIHGDGGQRVPFEITRHEAEILVRHWLTVAGDIEAGWAAEDSVGSDEIRLHPYAHRRVDTLVDAGAISADRVAAIVTEIANG